MRSMAAALLLLLGMIPLAQAQTQRFGAWEVTLSDDKSVIYAQTTNDSKAVFGQLCDIDGKKCYWILSNNTGCREKADYSVLANTDSGAAHLAIMCFLGSSDDGSYAFKNFDAITEIIKGGSQKIGLAFPLKNGQFIVSRFDLNGSSQAVGFMRETLNKYYEAKAAGTKDVRM